MSSECESVQKTGCKYWPKVQVSKDLPHMGDESIEGTKYISIQVNIDSINNLVFRLINEVNMKKVIAAVLFIGMAGQANAAVFDVGSPGSFLFGEYETGNIMPSVAKGM